jgi:hypothetical protein
MEKTPIRNTALYNFSSNLQLAGLLDGMLLLLLQAASMFQKFYSPNILAVASSLVGEDSLSHHVDPAIGQPLHLLTTNHH